MPSPETESVIVWKAEAGWQSPLAELWRHRDLLYFLAGRDIKVRYKQTALGVAWAVIQPLFIAFSLSLFLWRFAKVSTENAPALLFAYTAMIPWQFFSQAVTEASNSLVHNEKLITKVYFPRLLIPMSAVAASFVDCGVAFVVLIPLLAYYGVMPGLAMLALPFLVLLTALIALGAALWLSALNVQYRDVRYTIGFLLQLCFFVTPVAYPSSAVPERWRLWYALNPMAGAVEAFRWSILGTRDFPALELLVSLAVTLVLLSSGLSYFRRMEDCFADLI